MFPGIRIAGVCLVLLLGGASVPAQDQAESLLQKAAKASARGDTEQAIAQLTQAIALDPKQPLPYYLRGREYFRAGKIKESVRDFDKHVELDPKAESRQWERGISYYYAGQFEKGAKQFELYQTYHDQDVENSTWRYLCLARAEGVEKARHTLLPITKDPRVPMMPIYDLYSGKLKPADVLAAAEKVPVEKVPADKVPAEEAAPGKEALRRQLFYAHLYIGLWHEAAGEKDLAKKHILEAEKHKIGHYMWDVAHIHADLLRDADPLRDKAPKK